MIRGRLWLTLFYLPSRCLAGPGRRATGDSRYPHGPFSWTVGARGRAGRGGGGVEWGGWGEGRGGGGRGQSRTYFIKRIIINFDRLKVQGSDQVYSL